MPAIDLVLVVVDVDVVVVVVILVEPIKSMGQGIFLKLKGSLAIAASDAYMFVLLLI